MLPKSNNPNRRCVMPPAFHGVDRVLITVKGDEATEKPAAPPSADSEESSQKSDTLQDQGDSGPVDQGDARAAAKVSSCFSSEFPALMADCRTQTRVHRRRLSLRTRDFEGVEYLMFYDYKRQFVSCEHCEVTSSTLGTSLRWAFYVSL